MSSVEWRAASRSTGYHVAKPADGWTVTVIWCSATSAYSWLVVDTQRGVVAQSADAQSGFGEAKKAGLAAQHEAAKLPRPRALANEIQCGTPAGYRRHYRAKTKVCQPCRDAHNAEARDKAARDKAAGRPRVRASKPKPKVKGAPQARAACGSNTGWAKHRSENEVACDPCRLAHNKYTRERRNKRKELAS